MKRVVVSGFALVLLGAFVLLGFWISGFGVSNNVGNVTCADSGGQQGRDREAVFNGVEGLVLPGSANPASLTPFLGPGGRKYYVYKVYLAVSSSDKPFATVSIVKPASARLYYGPPLKLDQTLVYASRETVRLPVCGPRFSGFAGGVVLDAPSRVTFQVTSPRRHAVRVTVSIGDG